jgi:hypothetical protein
VGNLPGYSLLLESGRSILDINATGVVPKQPYYPGTLAKWQAKKGDCHSIDHKFAPLPTRSMDQSGK